MPLRPGLCRGVALVLLALLVLAAPARAQTAAPPPAAPPVSADELKRLVDTINDPAQRQRLVGQLQALIAVERGEQTPDEAAPATIFDQLSGEIDAITGEILAAAQVVLDAPRLVQWLQSQAENEAARDFWLAVGLRLALIFGIGFVADRVAYLLLRGVQRKVATLPGVSVPTRLFLMLLATVIELLPLVVFAAAASFAVPLTQPDIGTREVARVLVGAILWTRIALAIARIVLLAPSAQALYPLGGETRQYLYIWARRFASWAVYGYALATASWWLGVPGAIFALILRGTILGLTILAIVFVLQNRAPVAEWLRGSDQADGVRWRVLRSRLGESWHVLAIAYVVGTFGVYVLNAEGGFTLLLRATALSLVVISGAAILARFSDRLLRRSFAVSPELSERFPRLEARANRYTALISRAASAIIYVLAAAALLEAWGIAAFTWLADLAQQPSARSVISLAIVLLGGLVLWEFFSATIERKLARIDHAGRSRARTVLPLLRSTVLVVLIIIAGLMILSQIGINIAPLLAGAGIAGIAIGFGAQALVKDVITGFFMLLEDTFAVGDRVDVGGGHVGVIEAVSIRNFRLRDIQGIVHTVPFSAITTVLNMSRDFAYVVCDAGIVYREDPDRVIEVMREAGKELAAAPRWSRYVLTPLEILGIERFTDTAMIIRARIKTAPPFQLELGREFNRVLKKAFDRAGIEMASVNQLNYAKQLAVATGPSSPVGETKPMVAPPPT
jgi:moderate conductance mechanosensitive channel